MESLARAATRETALPVKIVDALHDALFTRQSVSWTALEPLKRGQAAGKVEPVERNERWRVLVHRKPEIDE